MNSGYLESMVNEFKHPVKNFTSPKKFTFPYYYAPHPIAEQAIDELQQILASESLKSGNMFAVLVVSDSKGKLGYLSSFSGYGKDFEYSLSFQAHFVPNIFDQENFDAKFKAQKEQYQQLQIELESLNSSNELSDALNSLEQAKHESNTEISQFKSGMNIRKTERKIAREESNSADLIKELEHQSRTDKRNFQNLKAQWKQALLEREESLNLIQSHIAQLENQYLELRQTLDIEKQKACQFLNCSGETQSLYELFKPLGSKRQPICGANEQNLPKLLQAAFHLKLTPIALGEFWWGDSPYTEIRQHKNLYPVNQSKCFEILEHILSGIELDNSPLEQTPSLDKPLEIVYEDDVMVVVNKPAEFLSVSGKYIHDSVEARMKSRYPDATGALIVHRLDMSTSGLMVLALTPEANKEIQKQFIERTVVKRYTASLEGEVAQTSGTITLPLAGDLEDRPRQKVDHANGRKAETTFQVIDIKENRTLVHLYPKTGRTHQLRVHCAHQVGLNTPIVGDDLYGFKDNRLHLHAGYLKLRHPETGQEMEFEVNENFKCH